LKVPVNIRREHGYRSCRVSSRTVKTKVHAARPRCQM
jgi:hypothetical protein